MPLDTEIPTKVQYVFDLISQTRAAIRLINTGHIIENGNKCIDFELNMSLNPIYHRPIKKAERSSEKEREQYRDQRTDSKFVRAVIQNQDLSEQKPIVKPPVSGLYFRDGLPIKRTVFAKRGQPKLTVYSKKVSFSLLNCRGRTYLFKNKVVKNYRPIGFITDINTMHQKGQRYIWDKDSGTNGRFWFGESTKYSKEHWQKSKNIWDLARGSGLSLRQLQRHINADDDAAYQKEMLMGYNKACIKALFTVNNTIYDRLRLLSYSHHITQQSATILQKVEEKHKLLEQDISKKTAKNFELPKEFKDYSPIKVPLMIIDGLSTPKEYTTSQMMIDLECLYAYYTSLQSYYPLQVVNNTELSKSFLYFKKILGKDYNGITSANGFAKAVLAKIKPHNNHGKIFDSNSSLTLNKISIVNHLFFRAKLRTILFLTLGLPLFLIIILPVLIYQHSCYKKSQQAYNRVKSVLYAKNSSFYSYDDTDSLHNFIGLREQESLYRQQDVGSFCLFSSSGITPDESTLHSKLVKNK